MPSCFKDVPTTPIVGQLDLRSPSGTLGQDDFRLLYNVRLVEGKNRCRDSGWKRLFRDSPYGFKNQDFHDQLLSCQTYYEEFDYTRSSPGGLVGTEYGINIPAYTVEHPRITQFYEPICGYYSDRFPHFSTNPADSNVLVVDRAFSGYPYFFVPSTGLTFCPDGPAGAYEGSYYYKEYSRQDPDTEVPAFQDELMGVYVAPYSEEYTVCGDTIFGRDGCREAITLITQVSSDAGTRRLVAATKSRIVTLNERTGNWKLIADGLGGPVTDDNCGCSGRRFNSATLGGFTFFTNNYDPVLQWRYDAPTTSCKLWAANYVEDLLTLGITRAKCVVEWKGFLIVGGVEQDGLQRPFRIFWSDFNDPTSFIPGAESLAGTQDFTAGEEIIAMAKLGGGLRVYTNKAIYAASLVGGDLVFSFEEIYSGPNVIAFQYSLANAGDTHYYLSFDSVYRLRESDRSPTLEQWMHKAAGAIYNGVSADYLKGVTNLISPSEKVNLNACDQVVGYYRKETDELFFSWPTGTATCPNLTLRMTVRFSSADLIDYGFSAFAEFHSDTRPSVIDWLVDQQLCNWDSSFADLVKEGIPYSMDLASFPNPPDCLINPTEDPSLPSSANSWCARLGRKTIDDFCGQCDDQITFIGASASDKTLKEFDDEIYYREEILDLGTELDCPYTSEATYVRNGYTTLAQHDNIDWGTKLEKTIERVVIDFNALEQSTPGQLYVQVAYGRNAHCPKWSEVRNKPFACITDYSDEEADFYHVRPNEMPVFKFKRRGEYIGMRWWVTGTGSGGCFTKVTRRMSIAQSKWP